MQLDERRSHKERTYYEGEWEIVRTDHAEDRESERLNSSFPGGFEQYVRKIIAKVSTWAKKKDGEYLFYSQSVKQGAIVNLDFSKPQIRIITVLPTGNSFAKPGTGKVLIEGVEYDAFCIDSPSEALIEGSVDYLNKLLKNA